MNKDLNRKPPRLTIEHQKLDDNSTRITLTADRYACFVHFDISDESLTISDNYFDMEAGDIKEVTIEHAAGVDPTLIQIRAQ